MLPLTIVYTTARHEPKFEWFFESLFSQCRDTDRPNVIVVDTLANARAGFMVENGSLPDLSRTYFTTKHVLPKPTIWQGKHRITKEDWWAKSNALNTGIILCKTEWIAFVDDRSVLCDGWLRRVEAAMNGNYAVCGSYEKRANLQVENGEVVGGEILGVDTRTPGLRDFDSYYGGSGALPLEWCLAVNGFSENMCDGLGSEDSQFGTTLLNSGYPVKYDSDMRIIEDRTPGQIDGALKRADKNSHLGQRAKSWDIVRAFRHAATSGNSFDIRNLRDRVLLNGESLDSIKPSASHFDWYDGQYIGDME